jgi:Na+/H+ antiporter NhaD/arsenite permease-like protein
MRIHELEMHQTTVPTTHAATTKWIAGGGLAAMIAVFLAVWLGGRGPTPALLGIRAEFYLFAITLLGVALLHHLTLEVALSGLGAVLVFRFAFTDFQFFHHLHQEWRLLVNLFGLLMGFEILAKHFEESRAPDKLPDILPDGWKGGFGLLCLVGVLSCFLDNIAAAMIGGTIANVLFKGRVHIGYLAAIVAASNAGGAGSVVGDTTTTMMWIDGISPLAVLHAFVGAAVAIVFSGLIAARQQDRLQRIQKDPGTSVNLDWARIAVVGLILAGAIATNLALDFPAVGVWAAILLCAAFVKTPWSGLQVAWRGSLFLVSLVLCASLMPVEQLPAASWQTAFGLGFVSAVFDNIPLTKLALDKGGYDWGFLAFTVGYGGSMVWFGSSAGVALSNIFPQAKSVGAWLKHGWHVAVAYVLAVLVMLWAVGWNPPPPHKRSADRTPAAVSPEPQRQ